MQDIMVTPRQRGNKSSRLVIGIVRTLLMSLMLGLLICFDFIMYQRSGTVFFEKTVLHFPVLISCGFLLLSAFVLMVATSFSRFVQLIIFGICCFVLTIGFMNQFLQIDKSQYLTVILSPYIDMNVLGFIDGYSHWIIAFVVALISYLMLKRLSLKGMFSLVIVLFVLDGWALGTAALLGESQKQTKEIYTSAETDFSNNGNKLIFLFMPRTASYPALVTNSSADSDKSRLLRRVELGFLMKYGFKFHPNAFVSSDNQDSNLVDLVNILDNKPFDDHLLNNVGLEGLWKFRSSQKSEAFLKDNQLQDVFKKAKYKITAYQNQRLELCKKNNQYTVDRCINRVALPFDIASEGLSNIDRANILFAEWLSSLDILSNSLVVSTLQSVLDRKTVSNLLLPYSKMYVVNSFDVLQHLLDDIAADKKSAVYFVYIDFPGDLNVYDEWCHLKPHKAWSVVSSESKNSLIGKNIGAYNEQMLCFWGQMSDFMQKLSKMETAKNLTFVLQGISGIAYSDNSMNTTVVNNFKNSNTVLTAIRLPQAKFGVYSNICRSKDILRHYLFSAPKCKEFQGLDISTGVQETIKNEFNNSRITKSTLLKATQTYKKWLADWKTKRTPIFQINKVVEEQPEEVVKTSEDELLTDDAVNALNQNLPAVQVEETKGEAVVSETDATADVLEKEKGKGKETETKVISSKDEKSAVKENETLAEKVIDDDAIDDLSDKAETSETDDEEVVSSDKNKIEDLPLEHAEVATVPTKVETKNSKFVNKVSVETKDAEAAQPQPVMPQSGVKEETVPQNTQTGQAANVSADFLLEDDEEEWALDPAKALGVSGEEKEEIIVKIK